MPEHPSPSHRLRWAGRNVAVGPDGDPLRMHDRRVGLEVTELLLLSQPAPPVRTPGLDGVDSLHIRSPAMRSIAVLTAAVLAAVVSPANAEKLKLRCASPESPLGP